MSAINEWKIGGVQEPHNDSISDVDLREGVKDETSREWTVILYINGHEDSVESFRGGETYFPHEGPTGQIMTPVRGTGIAFRGIDLEHGVYPVRRGSRYTISQWYSSNRSRIITDERTKDLHANHLSLRQSS